MIADTLRSLTNSYVRWCVLIEMVLPPTRTQRFSGGRAAPNSFRSALAHLSMLSISMPLIDVHFRCRVSPWYGPRRPHAGRKRRQLARMKTLRARVRQNSDRRASQKDRLRVQSSGPPKNSELFFKKQDAPNARRKNSATEARRLHVAKFAHLRTAVNPQHAGSPVCSSLRAAATALHPAHSV